MPDLYAGYRRQAEVARRNAERARSPADAAAWRDIAEAWSRLVPDNEHVPGSTKSAPRASDRDPDASYGT